MNLSEEKYVEKLELENDRLKKERDKYLTALERISKAEELAMDDSGEMIPTPEAKIAIDALPNPDIADVKRYVFMELETKTELELQGQDSRQYRRGIKVLDKILHETNGVSGFHLNGDIATWDQFLDGMTLHDFLWEAGQLDKDEEDK